MLAWRRVRVVLFCLLRFALELFDGFFQLRDLLAEFLGFRQFIGQTTGIAVLGAGGRSKPVGDSVQGAREILKARAAEIDLVPFDDDRPLLDIDTPEDYSCTRPLW